MTIVVPSVSGASPVLWSHCSTKELLLFFPQSLHGISAWSFVGVLVSGWSRGPVQKPVGPRMGLTLQGQPYCSSNAFSLLGQVCGGVCVDMHSMAVWWTHQTGWGPEPGEYSTQGMSVLASWGVLGCGCYSVTKLSVHYIVSVSWIWKRVLINIFFLLSDHVLKDTEP